MSREALAACLATREREAWTLRLGLSEPECGQPPFDVNVPDIELLTLPWEPWPLYDPAIFGVDQRRILRWYQARGFYQTRILEVRYLVDDELIAPPETGCTSDECDLEIRVKLSEGEPVIVRAVGVSARAPLDPELMDELYLQPRIEPGDRFDEALYAADKERLLAVLHEHAYARAEVDGQVSIDRKQRSARIEYRVEPGRQYRFGRMRAEGHGDFNPAAILEVAGIAEGKPFSQSEITDAEQAVYALGVFSSVRIEPEFREQDAVADLLIRVTRARTERFRVGIGVMSGMLKSASSEISSVPQWDVHLVVGYSNENFLGDMRKLRIEERPRLIMLDSFPNVPGAPKPGNAIKIEFEQPRFPEARTVSFTTAQWDYGPDPFFGFFRHDLATRLGARRKFFRQRFAVELALQHDLFEIENPATAPPTVSSYRLPFADQQLQLDLRNDARRPSRGVYLATTVQEAVQLDYGSWNYVRVLPEVRAYQRLFLGLVLAERAAFGALFILDSDPLLDPTSRLLGPQNYRLRGGGATSNRGFGPGELGDGIDGGKRRWEGSVELRVPLGGSLGFALFFDVGDVSRSPRVRFGHLNASTGFGLRYYTAFAPIRFDAGWRIPGWQRVGGDAEPDVGLEVLPSAMHLTLGEAF